MSKSTIKTLLCAIALTTISACTQAPRALASQPWWKLHVDTAPTILQPGQAKNEVQEIPITAVGGNFTVISEPGEARLSHRFAWDATHQEVQEGFEEMFGKGNVEVPTGQGNATGSEPYRIIWKGEYADFGLESLHVYGQLTLPNGQEEIGENALKGRVVVQGRTDGTVVLTAANLGNEALAGSVTFKVKLPAGLTAISLSGEGGLRGESPLECTKSTMTCTFTGSTEAYGQARLIIPVNINAGAKSGETIEFQASGGDAAPAKMVRPIVVGDVPASFDVEDYEILPEEEGGAISTQAGAHPFQLTTTLMLNQRFFANIHNSQFEPQQAEMPKDLVFKLPPGLIGNPTPFPQCTIAQFDSLAGGSAANQCPNDTAIGVATVTIVTGAGKKDQTVPVPLFNLTPSVGEPARFGFYVLHDPVFLDTSVRTGGDYGVTVKVTNIVQTVIFEGSRVTFWGVPGDPRHDAQRGWSCVFEGRWQREAPQSITPCSAADQHSPPPLLELPTSCTGPLRTSMEADSWQDPERVVATDADTPLPALDGCNKLPFNPSISVAPDSQAGSTPSGLTVGIHVPQDVSLDAEGLGEADVKDTTVVLPTGVALNPSAADGLLACSEAEVGLPVDFEAGCPEAAKVATLEIKSPLLPNPLTGAAYLAQQSANPFGSLVALYFVAKDPVSGTLIKIAGEVKPDPVTGQLVSTFLNTPQLPFEDLKLHFFGGDRAPLATPAFCGAYTTSSSIAPWSDNSASEPSSTFDVTTGPNGSSCPGSALPFNPSLTAGTTSIQAGGFSPFTMTMSRPDGSQDLQAITLKMPPGLLGTLSGVKLCPEAEANAGTCGPESLIGHTTVSVGVGGDPYTVTGGEVFITEGYKGAPYGLSIVNPAVAGPYNLGKVIVRAKIEVDPITAALTVTTDTSGPYKIPTILDGIPLQIQHVNVSIDRSSFTFNPTNCSPLAVTGSLESSEGSTKALSVPFQVTNCAVLAFKPKLTASTNGKTSRAIGASLKVKLVYPAGPYDANIAKVKVDLPKQLPSKLPTLQKACPAATFNANPAGCPAASIVGHATAHTPVLPVALSGPAYFVSHGGEAFPDLVIVLQGYGTTVHLVGSTFINEKTGVTSSTFKQIPDVPVGTFELTLPQGKYSALAATANLCTTKLAMPTSFVAQNGAEIHTSTPIAPTGCAKHKARKKAGKHRKGQTPKKKK